MSKVLVILVTYNGLPWLERCLSSVLPSAFRASGAPGTKKNGLPGANKGSGAPGELEVDVFVWDNGSTDGSADFIAQHFPQAHLVRSAENRLFARPNNEGLRYALDHGYDYAYLLNQDAWLEPGALETLLAVASEHPEYAVLSPLQLAPDGMLDANFAKVYGLEGDVDQVRGFSPDVDQVQGIFGRGLISGAGPGPASVASTALGGTSGGLGPKMGWTRSTTGMGRSEAEAIRDCVSSAGPMAAHWLVNLEAVRQIGLFNEELFPLYGQDDDWCNRARYHGYKIGIIKEAGGVHDRAQRKEPKEKLIERNYRSASLVRLADVNRPLWCSFLYVCLFTLVKTVKYVSMKPIGLFPGICRQLPAVKSARLAGRSGGLGFVE